MSDEGQRARGEHRLQDAVDGVLDVEAGREGAVVEQGDGVVTAGLISGRRGAHGGGGDVWVSAAYSYLAATAREIRWASRKIRKL